MRPDAVGVQLKCPHGRSHQPAFIHIETTWVGRLCFLYFAFSLFLKFQTTTKRCQRRRETLNRAGRWSTVAWTKTEIFYNFFLPRNRSELAFLELRYTEFSRRHRNIIFWRWRVQTKMDFELVNNRAFRVVKFLIIWKSRFKGSPHHVLTRFFEKIEGY